jgi:hypothetical protein
MPNEDSDWSNLAFGLNASTCSHQAGLHGADELTLARASPHNASELRPREKDFDADQPPSVFNLMLVSSYRAQSAYTKYRTPRWLRVNIDSKKSLELRSETIMEAASVCSRGFKRRLLIAHVFEQASIDWILSFPALSKQCASSSRSASPRTGCLLAAATNTRPPTGCGSHNR